MNCIYLLLVIFTSGVLSQIPIRMKMPDEAKMTYTQIANKYGQEAEEYDVISEGGYILKLFHIPGDRTKPILCVHGAIDSADSFIMRGNTSLSVALARDNYDVWAMNYRGNKYSRRHTKMNPDSDQEFWNFSAHEIGYYDVKAHIDFILKKTGEKSLSVIGYSEGTMAMYVLGATRPEYNDKVKILISLAPICFIRNTGLFMSLVLHMAPILNVGLQAINSEEVGGQNSTTRSLIKEVCSEKYSGYETCLLNGLFLVTGSDPSEIEPAFFPVIIGHFPAGTSRKNLNHLVQISQHRKFSNYDYGLKQNMAKYKRPTPPEYDLNKVTMKIALIVAKNDKISTIKDVEKLRKRLPNVVEYRVMKSDAFNHVDYVWGKSTHKTLFPHIFRILNKYNK
ncbi:hypothetical protein PYW07_004822 [Mythimna separata]|uniref:Lipase n=1 Tax=Mythimna separata TaxID=271217 RepID=A0AAD7YXU5_MYTSE|nr:hypothetical protein PYW07_004822 [Mythimna separata]